MSEEVFFLILSLRKRNLADTLFMIKIIYIIKDMYTLLRTFQVMFFYLIS